MFPCMLSKMESQGGNELYGTGIATTAASMRPTNFEHWNTEQIGDFVRKLGFLDKEKDKGEGYKIKHFLHVNEVPCTCTCTCICCYIIIAIIIITSLVAIYFL